MSQLNQQMVDLIARWANWSKRLKFYGPPDVKAMNYQTAPSNGLPDIKTDPLAAWCHVAIIALSPLKHDALLCIYGKPHVERRVPAKRVADWHKVHIATVYREAHLAAGQVVTTTRRISQRMLDNDCENLPLQAYHSHTLGESNGSRI